MAFWNATPATAYPGIIDNIKVRGWTAQYNQRIALGATGVVAAVLIDSSQDAPE